MVLSAQTTTLALEQISISSELYRMNLEVQDLALGISKILNNSLCTDRSITNCYNKAPTGYRHLI